MPKKQKIIIQLVEWDGDRSSACGGLNIQIHAGGEILQIENQALYDSDKERSIRLASMRAKAIRVGKALGLEVEENLLC